MRGFVVLGALGVAALALTSCATLDEGQCQVVDWQQLGESDGSRGQPSIYLAEHQKACARFEIPVDAASWQSGWERGIRSYCTPANGLAQGRSGSVYRNSCPADQASAFAEAHRVGRAVHDARSRRDTAQTEIDDLIRELSAATTAEERAAVQLRIELKRNDLARAQSDVFSAEREADRYQLQLAQAG